MNFRPTPLDVAAPIDLAREAGFRLGATEVRPPTLELARAGHAQTVEPKVMQALVALSRHQGAVTSRDELVETCWGGRIVSEDAIQRTIAKLRHAAEAHAGGDFAVETIPRVGYRLLVRGQAPKGEAAEATVTPARLGPWRWLVLAGLVALVAALGFTAWKLGPRASKVATVQIEPFRTIGSGVPNSLPASFVEDVRDAFGEDNALMIKSRGADYVLHGVIQRSGDNLRYSIRLEDARDGTTVWTASPERPLTNANGARRTAVDVSQAVRCGLKAAGAHPGGLPQHTLSLFLQHCDARLSFEDQSARSLALGRRVTAESPAFSQGWSGRAFAAWVASQSAAGPEKDALRAEAAEAAARALRLDPENAQGYEVQAFLASPGAVAERERLLRRAAAARLSECGCELYHLAFVLRGTGRAREANAVLRRAYDQQPLSAPSLLNLMRSHDSLGEWQAAETLARRFDAIYGSGAGQWPLAIHASYAGDWSEALRYVDTVGDPGARTVLREAVRALASRDPARIAAARPGLEALARASPGERFGTELLFALGSLEEGFRQLDVFVSRDDTNWSALFDPRQKALRHDPRHIRLLEKVGLIAFWRNEKIRPDICREPGPPTYCRSL